MRLLIAKCDQLIIIIITFVGHNKDFASVSVPVTFTSNVTKVVSIIPVFQDRIIEGIEIFDLSIDIPSTLKHRIHPRKQRKAIASIIDTTSKLFTLGAWLIEIC